jgi:hypothetical protein
MYGKYSNPWRRWLHPTTHQQEKSTIKRGIISFTNVKFTREEEYPGGYRKLHKSIKDRMQTDPFANWARFG